MTNASYGHKTDWPCPVCQTSEVNHFLDIGAKTYWSCARCDAVFLDPGQLPTQSAERAHYAHHNNDPHDPAYRAFLAKLATPLLAKLLPKQTVLDFGSGPGPALAVMLREAGHEVSIYDPAFAPDTSVLNTTYDAVTCTETIEHFHEPAREFATFSTLLKPGGWLGIMTSFRPDDGNFADWHYPKDPTHVVFYNAQTFEVLAAELGWHLEIPMRNVVLMQKLQTADSARLT